MRFLGAEDVLTMPWIAGGLKVVPLGRPAAPTVTPNVTGSTTYTYAVVAVDGVGYSTNASVTTTIANGPATLDGTHTITITWTAPAGTAYVYLLRSAGGPSQGAIASGGVPVPMAGSSFIDTGAPAVAYTPPATDQTGALQGAGYVSGQNLFASQDAFIRNNIIVSGVVDANFTSQAFVSVAALTAIYTLAVTAGLLGTASALRVKIAGTYIANSGTPTFRFQVLYGATVLWDGTTAGLSAFAASGVFEITLTLATASGSATAQVLEGSIRLGNRVAPATGTGTFGAFGGDALFAGTALEDSTLTKNFAVKFLPSINNVAVGLTVTTVIAELLP